MERTLAIKVGLDGIDEALKKAKQLRDLLKEASLLVDELAKADIKVNINGTNS
ncbi:MAG: hypothetical protein ACE3JK_01035 [Sporolactobacillus sp.]